MTLAQKYSHFLIIPSPESSLKSRIHTVEVFLDLICPFSKKMFMTLMKSNIQFIFRPQIQPWHPQSALLHYAVMAVGINNPVQVISALLALYNASDLFQDIKVQSLSPNEVYIEIASVLAKNGVEFRPSYLLNDLLVQEMKYHIKYSRQLGVHVSPTVYIDGIRDDNFSSSWTVDQWNTYLSTIN